MRLKKERKNKKKKERTFHTCPQSVCSYLSNLVILSTDLQNVLKTNVLIVSLIFVVMKRYCNTMEAA